MGGKKKKKTTLLRNCKLTICVFPLFSLLNEGMKKPVTINCDVLLLVVGTRQLASHLHLLHLLLLTSCNV